MPLLLLFIIIPILEIALFIQIGDVIGLWPTLGSVVLTACIGTTLLRHQGLSTMARLQSKLQTGDSPVDPMIHAALILVSAVLLITPGFFTDAIGLMLLVPPIRSALIKRGAAKIVKNRFVYMHPHGKRYDNANTSTINGDYTIIEDPLENPEPKKRGTSGWTKY